MFLEPNYIFRFKKNVFLSNFFDVIIKILCFNSFYIVNTILKCKNRLNIDLKNAKSIFAFPVSRF